MNPLLEILQPYPFERLRKLLDGVVANPALPPLNLSIGEPKHPTPELLTSALASAMSGLAIYPATAGTPALREAIADWICRRYGLAALDPMSQVLPINGSREALFAFAQSTLNPSADALVLCPNPFYQIYEGAALLAGATPVFIEQDRSLGFRCDWSAVPKAVWQRTQLLYVCSPGNPTGAVMDLDEWRLLFDLSDQYGFIIASDECYSEIYLDEQSPPLGSLQAAHLLGRDGFPRQVAFSSLSKRSNAPGLRSGFIAGDAQLIRQFLLYRTYHGSAMSLTVQAASIAAWNDEVHVRENRAQYRSKFQALAPLLLDVLDTSVPEAGFYFWAGVPGGDDAGFVRELYRQYNVLALPGSYLGREVQGRNPGSGFVRFALVEPQAQSHEAANRFRQFIQLS
ncbi:MAG: succinyldiaminopimelate transaminase [Quisquiliibacterium sp.]